MNWKIMGVGMVFSFALIAVFARGFDFDPRELPETRVGNAAPTFKLPFLGLQAQGEFDLSSAKGSPVVINFWSTTCIPCAEEHPDMLELATLYKPKGVIFMGILHPDKEDGQVQRATAYLKRKGANYPTLLDPKKRTAMDYGVTGIPETYVIDKDGVVREKFIGSMKPNKVKMSTLLDSLL